MACQTASASVAGCDDADARACRMPLTRRRNPELRGIGVYGLATGFAAVLSLVLTRVLWRSLTPSDFGTWALVDPMLLPTASLVLFGVDHAIVKQLRVDRLPLAVVTGTLLATTLPATTVCLIAAGLVARFAFELAWTDALLLTMAGEALILMVQTAFRATGAVSHFAAALLGRNLLYLAVLSIVLSARGSPMPLGVVFLTRGCCALLVGLVALAVLRPVLRINATLYRDAVRYGFPLLLTTFIYALSEMTDRWFLAEFRGVAAVGAYALHLKIAAILSQAIVIPFGLWFPPERFRRLDTPDGGRGFFIRTAVVLAAICIALAGGVWLARDSLLPLIAPGVAASPLVLACCLGSVVCLALSQALNVGLLMPSHTAKNAICTIGAVMTTVLASMVLVPSIGMAGAAVSRMLGGFVLLAITAAWSHRVFPVAFPVGALLLYVVTASGLAVVIDEGTATHGLAGVVIALGVWSLGVGVLSAALWALTGASAQRVTPSAHLP